MKFNIDTIINKEIYYKDPLFEWDLILQDIIKLNNIIIKINNERVLANMLDSMSFIQYYDLSGNKLTSMTDLIKVFETMKIIQSYSVQYFFEIILKFVSEIRSIEREKYMLPVLSEFFSLYTSYWKPSQIRSMQDFLNI